MSLISVKNFVAPFTNRTHIFTIVFCTLAFALFRIQGGRIKVEYSDGSKPRATAGEPSRTSARESGVDLLDDDRSSLPSFIKNSPKAPARKAPDTAESGTLTISEQDHDLLGQMIGKKPLNPGASAEEQQRKRIPAGSNRRNESLDDIEKTLGLR